MIGPENSEIVINQHYGGLNPVLFGWQSCDPGYSYGPATRPYWLIHYVVSGFGTFEYKETIYNVNPGDIFIIRPFERTYYEADHNKPWKYIWIAFTTEETLPDCFLQSVIHVPTAGAVFNEMFHCRNMGNGRSAFLSSCLWKLLGILLDQGHATTDYVDKALHYMNASYMERITIQDICKLLNLERSYLYTLFKQKLGISPQEYLINLRLEKAAELMIAYNETPSTAAASVGYTDIYQFSKIFKKHFGISPREYIKNFSS